MTLMPATAVVGVTALLAVCCPPDDFKGGPAPRALESSSVPRARAGEVEVRYLGSGGFLIKRGRSAFMTAPLYSNPFLPKYEVCQTPMVPIESLISAFVEDQEIADDLPQVRFILSGHAHYDHLMDVPKVRAMYMAATRPPIVASLTAKRTLAPYGLGADVVALNEPGRNFVDFKAAKRPPPAGCEMPDEPGRWWPDSALGPDIGPIRVLATTSEHPRQFAGILFWPGCHSQPLAAVPTKAADYPVGETMAFLIDLLDERGGVAFRIYYEDAPLPPGMTAALEAQVCRDGHAVDLALLCTGNWREVPGSQTIVRKLGARDVILHHWEFFFDETPPRRRILLGLPFSEADPYKELVAAELTGPNPGAHVQVLKPGTLRTYAVGAAAPRSCPAPPPED
jgi:hypothetical protein